MPYLDGRDEMGIRIPLLRIRLSLYGAGEDALDDVLLTEQV